MMVLIAAACFADRSTPRDGSRVAARKDLRGEAGLAPDNAKVIEELLRRTKFNGTVRVIVQLRISAGPDETREQRIQTTRQSLLADLAHTPHKVIRVYTAMPAVALEASHEALRVLNVSRHVSRVDEDELAKPFKQVTPAVGVK